MDVIRRLRPFSRWLRILFVRWNYRILLVALRLVMRALSLLVVVIDVRRRLVSGLVLMRGLRVICIVMVVMRFVVRVRLNSRDGLVISRRALKVLFTRSRISVLV